MAAARCVAFGHDEHVRAQRGKKPSAQRAPVRARLAVRGRAHGVPASVMEVVAHPGPVYQIRHSVRPHTRGWSTFERRDDPPSLSRYRTTSRCAQLWCWPAQAIRAKTSAVPHAITTAAICPRSSMRPSVAWITQAAIKAGSSGAQAASAGLRGPRGRHRLRRVAGTRPLIRGLARVSLPASAARCRSMRPWPRSRRRPPLRHQGGRCACAPVDPSPPAGPLSRG